MPGEQRVRPGGLGCDPTSQALFRPRVGGGGTTAHLCVPLMKI